MISLRHSHIAAWLIGAITLFYHFDTNGQQQMTKPENVLYVEDEIPLRAEQVRMLGIASVTGYTSAAGQDDKSQSGYRSHELLYDKQGKRTKMSQYNRDGNLVKQWQYDKDGRIQQETLYGKAEKVDSRFEYIYPDGGDWTEKRFILGSGKFHYRIVAKRNPQGNILKTLYYDSSDNIIRTDQYIYDALGRLEKIDMGHMGEWLFVYENNKLKQKIGNLPSDSPLGTNFEFQYDARGLLKSMVHKNFSTTTYRYTFYDKPAD